jgi:hypothetical protein
LQTSRTVAKAQLAVDTVSIGALCGQQNVSLEWKAEFWGTLRDGELGISMGNFFLAMCIIGPPRLFAGLQTADPGLLGLAPTAPQSRRMGSELTDVDTELFSARDLFNLLLIQIDLCDVLAAFCEQH